METKQQPGEKQQPLEKILENFDQSPAEKLSDLIKKTIEITGEDTVRTAMNELIRQKKAQVYSDKYWEEVKRPVHFERWDHEQLKKHFLSQYHKNNGRHFILDNYSIPVLETLCLYFSQDERFEALNDTYSLQKGLILQGNVGSGKSSLMKIFQTNQKSSFLFTSCSAIARAYSQDGYKAIIKYMKPVPNGNRQRYFGQEQIGWCFDDLGFETDGKHFGKASNIMTELLQAIYDQPHLRGKIHLTTNLTAKDIEANYGNRIRSRMREMFNVISYDIKAPDRRS